VSGAPLCLEEALRLGEYQDTSPAQIGLQPSGTGNRAYLKKKKKKKTMFRRIGDATSFLRARVAIED